MIFPCPNMFRMSAKVVLCTSMTLNMSGSFLLMMLLYFWPMLLLVVGWITVTHFSGVPLSSIFINYSAFKIVQLESYQIPVDTSITQFLKQPPLFTSFFTLVFPSIWLHISLPTAVLTVPGAGRVAAIFLWFQSYDPLSTNLSSSLVIILPLIRHCLECCS